MNPVVLYYLTQTAEHNLDKASVCDIAQFLRKIKSPKKNICKRILNVILIKERMK